MKNSYTCLIPYLNEGDRLMKVLREVKKIKHIDEIVCVDDGSDIDVTQDIYAIDKKIKVIRLPKNVGKTEAISVGLDSVTGSHILLLDADLRNLKAAEIDEALRKTKENSEIDLVILRRINSALAVRFIRTDIILSGERIVKKSDLKRLLKVFKPKGFELEVAMNQYMIRNKKNAVWMPSSGVNTYKFEKRGFVVGIAQDVLIILRLIQYIGLHNYLIQISTFSRRRCD